MTPSEAIMLLGAGKKLTDHRSREIAELILRLETVAENSLQVSLDLCETCDLSPQTCNGEAFKNVSCPNMALRDAIKVVKL